MQTNVAEDPFWTERVKLFTAQLPAHYRKPMPVWGRFHTSEEQYFDGGSELIPLKQTKGIRTYVMMQPYVLEPVMRLTISLYDKPKHYADQAPAIGHTVGAPQTEEIREVQVGSAQAWYYPDERMLVLWECFFETGFRQHPLSDDRNMQQLWRTFERWLVRQFPEAQMLTTPFNDPIAQNIREYQTFLNVLGFSSLAKGVFGKAIR